MSPLEMLIIAFFLGALGQFARAVVAFAGKSSWTDAPSQSDVFSLARYVITIFIGGFAGVATWLVLVLSNKITTDSGADNSLYIDFVIAGYVGTDVLEAFIGNFLQKWLGPGQGVLDNIGLANKPATPAAGAPQVLSDLDTTLSKFAEIQARVTVKPTLHYSYILMKAKSWLSPDPKKAKDTDAPPQQPNSNNIIDFLRSIFGSVPVAQADVTRLDFTNYASLARTIGLLFSEKGGVFIDD